MRDGFKAAVSALALFLVYPAAGPAKTLQFAGYQWTVKAGNGLGPGPCNWSDANAWVDASGYLHLKLSKSGGTWSCAEVESVKRLGFGRYQFWVVGAIDELDPNVVLGLFDYPTPDVGPDTTNEIGIEMARWGNPSYPNLNFTVWPSVPGASPAGRTYSFSLDGTFTTQRFTWRSNRLLFQSLNGHRNNDKSEIARWDFVPRRPVRTLPQRPLPVHLNLWLFEGRPPTDGREVEIVIRSFVYRP
jgi:hypothetical protein